MTLCHVLYTADDTIKSVREEKMFAGALERPSNSVRDQTQSIGLAAIRHITETKKSKCPFHSASMEKRMKRKIGILIGQVTSVVVVALLAKPATVLCSPLGGEAFRQQPTVVSDGPQLLAQDDSLRERLRKREEAKIDKVAAELEKNPNLVDDPKYLEQHPRLGDYLANHPEAKANIKKDPKAFFQHLKERGEGLGG